MENTFISFSTSNKLKIVICVLFLFSINFFNGQTGPNDDFDGDGIPNSVDLDDDNDGISDVDESSLCFFDETFLESTMQIVGTDLVIDSSNPLAQARDFDNNSYMQTLPLSQNWVDQTVIEWSFDYPVPIESLDIVGAYMTTSTSELKLQGWDGSMWIDLSAPLNDVSSAKHNITLTNTMDPTGIFQNIRITGHSGVSNRTRIFESGVTLGVINTSFYPSTLPCNADEDGDGNLNHFDLDSDGDGCSDALEASVTGTLLAGDEIVAGPYGANGLANSIETSDNPTAVTNYINTYRTYALDADNTEVCTDTDGDGLTNVNDLDDDNDGILDVEETTSCELVQQTDGMTTFEYWQGGQTTGWHDLIPISGSSSNGVYDLNVLSDLDVYGMPTHAGTPLTSGSVTGTDKPPGSDATDMIDIVRYQGWVLFPQSLWGQEVTVRVTPNVTAVGTGAWVMSSDDNPRNWMDPVEPNYYTPLLDMQNFTNFSNPVQGWDEPPFGYTDYHNFEGPNGAQSPVNGSDGPGVPYPRNNPEDFELTFKINSNGHYFSMYALDPVVGWSPHFLQYSLDGTSFTNMPDDFFNSTPPCVPQDMDTDGDGIPNRKDLDSDGDGCSDASESGVNGNLIAGDLVNSDGTTNVPDAIAEGPYGANGLADPIETDDSIIGTTTYVSTYTLYALSSIVGLCLDSDGDGLLDIDDIDDDNDGILDADESPNCFYTEGEALLPISINSDLNLASTTVIESGIDMNNSTFFRFLDQQDVDGLTIIGFETAFPIELSEVFFFTTTATEILEDDGSAEPATAVLQAWDGSQWIDLSSNLDEFAVNMTIPITQNPGVYQKYRLFGIDGRTDAGARMGEILLTASGTFVPSLNPKPECADDLDADGLPNHLDGDSDDDGCPDAIEGTEPTFDVSNLVSQTDFMLSGGVDAQGLPLQMSSVPQGIGTSQDADTFDPLCNPPFCEDPLLEADNCDFDGDGILNIDDLDDDNDGVLDITECGGNISFSSFTTYPITEQMDLGTATFDIDQTGVPVSGGFYTNIDTGEDVNVVELNINSSTFVGASFEFSTAVTNFSTSIYDMDGPEFIEILAFNGATPYVISASEYTIGAGVSDDGSMNFSDNGNATAGAFVVDEVNRISLNLQGPVTKVIINMRETGATSRNFGIENPFFCMGRDTDGDGVPNRFDLDSDGDGCPDVSEATVSGNYVPGDVVNGDGTTNTTESNQKAIAEGPYGANGLADAVETDDTETAAITYNSSYENFAVDATVSNCVCYQPGTGTAVISPVGISTLDRYHNSADTQWPEREKSAYLVLDSQEKGFVITRLSETEILALNMVEGMLVYDTTNDCLKMCDGTEWFCLEQTCNE